MTTRPRVGAASPSMDHVGNRPRVARLQQAKPTTGSRRQQGSDAELLACYRAAREQCEVDRQLADWILDLSARLRSADHNFLYVDCNVDCRDLQAEVERLRLAIELARRCRR